MNPSFREILELLNKYEVDYIVVGGVAAVIQGAPITTFDLDALVRIGEDNADRLSLAHSSSKLLTRTTGYDLVRLAPIHT